MKGLNLHIICKKALQISVQRGLHSGYVLSARQKKIVKHTLKEPGIQERKELYADVDLHETEPDDDDFIHEESLDFGNLDRAYDEDIREKEEHRKRVQKRITYNKYFAPPRQPAMLTCNEIKCIKHLHESDPLNWDVRALSESFPATPEIIKKVLKSSYKLTPERAKKKDEAVHKNWELLAEGKLEADPKLIEHCKKFVNRKEVLLEKIKDTKFYLPDVKEEPTYNGGEMSKILLHYEKLLGQLQKERDSRMLPEGSEPEKEKKAYLEILHEEVEKVMSKRISKKESGFLKKIVNTYAKDITFKELESKTIQKAEKNQKINLAEKAILESKFGRPQQYTAPVGDEIEEVESKKEARKFFKKNTSIKLEKENESESYKLKSFDDDLPDLPSPDERTHFTKELGVGELLNKIKNPVEPETQKVAQSDETTDVETIAKEEEYFDKQVETIKNTPFWRNDLKSKERAELELQKEPVQVPSEFKRNTKFEAQMPDEYPLRIPVPKSKRGSGLTFRVKDCFYDDDGEFLYRVPGMVQEKTNL